MRALLSVLLAVAVQSPAQASASDEIGAGQMETLELALHLAGPRVAPLPISLVSTRPDGALIGDGEAWTIRQASGSADRIELYTRSEVFHCANGRPRNRRCLVKLASILTHEAWHFTNGPNEAEAYEVQLAFLVFHEASPETVTGVRIARDRVQAVERRAREDAWKRHRARAR